MQGTVNQRRGKEAWISTKHPKNLSSKELMDGITLGNRQVGEVCQVQENGGWAKL